MMKMRVMGETNLVMAMMEDGIALNNPVLCVCLQEVQRWESLCSKARVMMVRRMLITQMMVRETVDLVLVM